MMPPTRMEVVSAEHELEDQLRDQVLGEIRRRRLAPDEIAEFLGMMIPSVELLLQRRTWPLGTSLRVARGLGMKVEVVAKPPAD